VSPDDLREKLSLDPEESNSFFKGLDALSRYIMEHGATEKNSLDAIIRLRDLIRQNRIKDENIRDAIFSFCREAGLFPYMTDENASWRDQVALEFFKDPTSSGFTFHREQWQAFQLLISGKSLILSAPTSFGKSILIHSYISQVRPKCVVIVVPTIALLDQFRRKLRDEFGATHSIITRNDQNAEEDTDRIYILTQERLLERKDIEYIDLLAIDEYYKLDSDREGKSGSNRALLLNAALKQHLSHAKQIFFLGPTVASIAMRDDLREKFINFPANTSTVAVDIHDYKETAEPYKTLASLLRQHRSEKSLIYSKSPPAAVALSNYLTRKSPLPASKEILDLADWLAEYYHPSWSLVSALRAGYGIHHGSIPRSVAQILVQHFNEGNLNALICTSTLIEGVNTAAKNVFIFDKKISTKNYDYFDYRNIAGRSGRMGHHLVGRIFLFHEPPEPRDFEVSVPALGDDEDISDEILMNLPDAALVGDLFRRKEELFARFKLPPDLIKRFAPYGIGAVERVSDKIEVLLKEGDKSLFWRGYVKYKELHAVFSIAWPDLRFNKKRLSAEAAAFYANRLRGSQLLRVYFDRLVREKDELEHERIIENGFRALAAFDYSIPKLLVDMEALVNFHCEARGLEQVNYSLMAQMLDNLFNHHWIKALEEYGVPTPLGRKVEFLVRDTYALEDAIDLVKVYCRSQAGEDRLTAFEIGLIDSALS